MPKALTSLASMEQTILQVLVVLSPNISITFNGITFVDSLESNIQLCNDNSLSFFFSNHLFFELSCMGSFRSSLQSLTWIYLTLITWIWIGWILNWISLSWITLGLFLNLFTPTLVSNPILLMDSPLDFLLGWFGC
jgi:hypothetical protein